MTRTILRAAALTLALPVLAACATSSPAPDQEAVRYDSPPFQGTSFAECVNAGGYNMAAPWSGADFYDYPAGQRTYTFTGDGKGADAPAFKANTSDGVEMTVSGVVGHVEVGYAPFGPVPRRGSLASLPGLTGNTPEFATGSLPGLPRMPLWCTWTSGS